MTLSTEVMVYLEYCRFRKELDEKTLKVRQNRGLRNCARTTEVEAFEREWLAWVQAGAPKGRDAGPACPGRSGQKAKRGKGKAAEAIL